MNNADALAAEIVAFSNTAGGRIFIGVDDDGSVRGLSGADLARLNQLVANAASQNVRPAVNPLTDNVPHPNGTVMVISVPEGISKPYMDRNGAIWVKNGSDKRRATSREDLAAPVPASGPGACRRDARGWPWRGRCGHTVFRSLLRTAFRRAAVRAKPATAAVANKYELNESGADQCSGQPAVRQSTARNTRCPLSSSKQSPLSVTGSRMTATSTAATSLASWLMYSSRRWPSSWPTSAPCRASKALICKAKPRFRASSGKSWSQTLSSTATTSLHQCSGACFGLCGSG
ncbi:ATP-dependent DNA helicase [Candidatus Burkholderia brachyanthoides]|nr:ATP-dependent DNA helicase [Candidatus Burkholderia brachyanthoides]